MSPCAFRYYTSILVDRTVLTYYLEVSLLMRMAIASDVTKGVVKDRVSYAFLAAQRNDNRVQFPAISLINLLSKLQRK